VRGAPGEHVHGVAVDQIEAQLHGIHMPDGLGRVELRDIVVGQPDGPDLALPPEVAEVCQYSSSGVPSVGGACTW
jgi:hypothetical protein